MSISRSRRWEATLEDYLHEVEHAAGRIVKLEKAIDEAVQEAPAEIKAVIEALRALRSGPEDSSHRRIGTRFAIAV